jgi:hypothetical protein
MRRTANDITTVINLVTRFICNNRPEQLSLQPTPTLLRNGIFRRGLVFEHPCYRTPTKYNGPRWLGRLISTSKFTTQFQKSDWTSRSSKLLLVLAIFEPLLPLLLALTNILLDLLRRRVLNEITLLVEAGPLGQTVRNINASLAVEHVESRKSQYCEAR